MMRLGKTYLAMVALALVLVGSGCAPFKRKKPAPPPSLPPTLDRNRKIDIPQPKPTPPPEPESQPEPQPPAEQPKQKPKRSRTPKKVIVPPPADTTPEPAKPAPDASINAPMTNAQAEWQKQQTSNLLGSAESNLSNLHRSLSGDEQQMVSQIRNYIAQSRKAMTDGDLERAYNLANKANLLSSELVKE
jgi:outer membrane biosynthesis protein TonB